MLDDQQDWYYGHTAAEWANEKNFDTKKNWKDNYDLEESINGDFADRFRHKEHQRRVKAREDANGTTARNKAEADALVKERFAKIKVEREERKAEQAKLSTPGKARKFFK